MTVKVYKKNEDMEEIKDAMREIESLMKNAVKVVAEERDIARSRVNEAAEILREVEVFLGNTPYDLVDQELLEKIREYLYS